MVKLTTAPARTDLTDRECSKLIGCTIGGLCGMADKETIARAIQWWADNFESSGMFEVTQQMQKGISQ